jgi:hypothetical protein
LKIVATTPIRGKTMFDNVLILHQSRVGKYDGVEKLEFQEDDEFTINLISVQWGPIPNAWDNSKANPTAINVCGVGCAHNRIT